MTRYTIKAYINSVFPLAAIIVLSGLIGWFAPIQ